MCRKRVASKRYGVWRCAAGVALKEVWGSGGVLRCRTCRTHRGMELWRCAACVALNEAWSSGALEVRRDVEVWSSSGFFVVVVGISSFRSCQSFEFRRLNLRPSASCSHVTTRLAKSR